MSDKVKISYQLEKTKERKKNAEASIERYILLDHYHDDSKLNVKKKEDMR